jgi:hypothetical protein
MKRLQIDLRFLPYLDKAHRRTDHRSGNRLCVTRVVLVRFDEKLHELRWDNPHCVAHRSQFARQPLGPGQVSIPIKARGACSKNGRIV